MAALDEKLVVFKGETQIDSQHFLVEMSTDQRQFWVVAFSNERPESFSLDLGYLETLDLMGDGGYEGLMGMLRIKDGEMMLETGSHSQTVR
jgi:hypothetical protein